MALNANERYLFDGNLLDEIDRLKRKQAQAARNNLNVQHLSEITDQADDLYSQGFSGDYNSGRSVLGVLGIDHEGIGNEAVYHAQQGTAHYYTAVGMMPNLGGDAAFCIQSWSNPGASVLTNGGFETGDFTGWYPGGGGTAVVPAVPGWNVYSGDCYEGQYRAAYVNDGSGTANSSIFQSVSGSVTAGSSYLINAYVRLDAPSANVRLYLYALFQFSGTSPTGALPSVTVAVAELTGGAIGGDEWRRVSGGFTCLPGYSSAAGDTCQLYLKAQNTSGTEAFTAEFDSITLQKVDHYYLHNLAENYLPQGGVMTAGVDQNRDVASSFSAQIMVLRVARPITINGFLWDIRQTGNYALKYLYAANIASSFETLWTGTVAAGTAEVSITPTHPLKLTPGTYYIGLQRTSGASTWQDYNASTYASPDAAWIFDGIYYNTTGYASFTPGCKLVYVLND